MILRTLGSILLAASSLAGSGCVVVGNDTDSLTATTSASSTTGEASTDPTGGMTSTGTTAAETGSETSAPTSGATSSDTTEAGTSGTTEGTAGTTEAGTTEAGTTSTTSTTGTTAEGTTTGGDLDLPAACDAACETLLGCDPDAYPNQASCVAECLDGAPNGPECEAAAAVFNTCISGFDCMQLAAAMENAEFGACTDAFQEYFQVCGA